MRIISWNVFTINKKINQLIDFVLEKNPDVVCLQETPLETVKNLKRTKKLHTYFTHDFTNVNTKKEGYICTASKKESIKVGEINYFEKSAYSLLSKLIYKSITRSIERHNAIATTFYINNKFVNVINARLSCAIGTKDRLEQFQNILDSLDYKEINIICGDFNIVDGNWFNYLTGWLRGFKSKDYRTNERLAFEEICNKHGFVNVFRGHTTFITKRPMFQFDHILIPKEVKVISKEVPKKTIGSDHRMLMVDLDL